MTSTTTGVSGASVLCGAASTGEPTIGVFIFPTLMVIAFIIAMKCTK